MIDISKKILVTGANGFLGKNVCLYLKENGIKDIYKATRDTNESDLKKFVLEADIIYNFVGINRTNNENDFVIGNVDYLNNILSILMENHKSTSIVLSSSTQANLDNIYGKSKKKAEELLIDYSKKTGAKVFIYRFPNIFGKWSRPNYNSVVATFCHNISRELPIKINDENSKLDLVYIDDICKEMLDIYNDKVDVNDCEHLGNINIYHTTVGELADVIKSFYDSRKNYFVPELKGLNKLLYSTYLSYLEPDNFSYPLNIHSDDRGSFIELLKTNNCGQVSVNVIKPGITKGGHYHNTKNEKFIVVSGKTLIEFKSVIENCDNIIKYEVSSEDMKVVDIPCGYSHTIKNIGDSDAVVIMWANEMFDESNPDTYKY